MADTRESLEAVSRRKKNYIRNKRKRIPRRQIRLDRDTNIATTMKYDPADSYALSKPPIIIRCKPAEWEKALISKYCCLEAAIDYNDPRLDDFRHINGRTSDLIYWTEAGTDESSWL